MVNFVVFYETLIMKHTLTDCQRSLGFIFNFLLAVEADNVFALAFRLPNWLENSKYVLLTLVFPNNHL